MPLLENPVELCPKNFQVIWKQNGSSGYYPGDGEPEVVTTLYYQEERRIQGPHQWQMYGEPEGHYVKDAKEYLGIKRDPDKVDVRYVCQFCRRREMRTEGVFK